jgi:membrane-bound ClpP family serine protease
MKPKTNEGLGVILMVLALVLAFLAWQISPSLGITAFALFFIGAHLFYTERAQRRVPPPSPEQASPAPSKSDHAS